MHWADVLAEDLMERGESHVVATGITPSGPIHIGNMREVVTADAVHRAVSERGRSEMIYIGDTFDPLRKVYPFLSDDYEDHVGKPLSRIPCPCGDHASYAAHYLDPFLEVLDEIGVDPRVVLAHEAYEAGDYDDAIRTALDHAEPIRGILNEVAGRDLDQGWLPFNVLCPECGRFHGTTATGWDDPEVAFACDCGAEGTVEVGDGAIGKLPWRVDWPARWKIHEVTFEPFGKDHAAAGGSWDTGARIAEEVYGIEPPDHAVYEFLQLKGEGAMSSSTGTAIDARELLEMTPPEVMRFLLIRSQPTKHIDFDPGQGLVELVETYDDWEHAYFTGEADREHKELERTYELSQPDAIPDEEPPRVPFTHLIMVAQIADSFEEVVETLERSGYDVPASAHDRLRQRLDHARHWLDAYAPDRYRFELVGTLPDAVEELSEEQRGFLDRFTDRLESIEWTPEVLHGAVHEEREPIDVGAGDAFGAVYVAFLGKSHGPRAGYFLASMDREFVLERLRQAT